MYEYLFLLSILVALMMLICSEPALAAHQGPPKAKWDSIEGDREKKHEEMITSGSHEYRIEMAGEVDGVMTRMPISYGAYYQGWLLGKKRRLENNLE